MIFEESRLEFSSGKLISSKLPARLISPPNRYVTEQIVGCPSRMKSPPNRYFTKQIVRCLSIVSLLRMKPITIFKRLMRARADVGHLPQYSYELGHLVKIRPAGFTYHFFICGPAKYIIKTTTGV